VRATLELVFNSETFTAVADELKSSKKTTLEITR